MSHLDNGFRSLTLQRFPATDDVNPLQAWEAADEYLLQQLDDTEIRGPVLILNDAFGALSCALAEHKPYSIGDSYISELATRENLRLNGIDESSVKFPRPSARSCHACARLPPLRTWWEIRRSRCQAGEIQQRGRGWRHRGWQAQFFARGTGRRWIRDSAATSVRRAPVALLRTAASAHQ